MAQWIIYGSNGVAKAKVKELELHDEWMAECFLTVSIKSATPISFAVGDYIDYRGERYTIQYDPNVIKKATSGSYGEGFTYDNIKFVGLQDEVVRCDFNDLVLNDNDMHYSALPTFPFYCESVDDLLDRIQANLEDLYPGQWIVIGLNTVRNSQRGTAVGRAQAFIDAYKQYIDPTGTARTDPYGKQGVAETADHITCWDAMKKVHDDFDLNFIVRGRVIVVGTAGVFTANTFRYGKGNGLKEIERIGESDQRIVTRLRAYGSEENLPAHYYNTVNKQVYANVTSILHKFDTTGADFLLNLDFDKKYFTYRSESYPGTTEAPNYIIEMKANDVTVRGYVTKDAASGKCYVYCESVAGDDDRDEPDATKMAAFVEALTANDRLDFVDYVNRDAFGEGHYDYATSHLPDNMAVSRLMLPGFPTMSLNSWVQAHKNDADKTWLAQAIADGFTFSTEIYRPYIDSPNKTQYGVRPGSVYFDGSDETENIHPTIEGMSYNDAPIDEIYAADQVEDNGVYPAGEEVKPIKITLPNLGFALDKYYEDGASIDMKNGMCGARSFKLTGKPKKNNDNRWVCEVERVHDDSLDLWFPYSDFQIHGSSEVGRDHGDKYILTGIDMPDTYIDAAAVKLLQYSIEALKKNHAPRYTYQPRIDNIFMQRQHDTASASQGVVSLHDILKAGDVFAFADTDLNIDANVIIDILTIRENGDNGIPSYEVTLRDEKQVGTIQKITNKVDSIISGATSINGATGGGLTTRQIQSLINRYGGEQFLSKLNDDTAAGYITFLKGLQIGANFIPDILGEGGVLRIREDGKVELVTDILYARMRAYFDSVVVREYRHESGNRIKSPAQGFNASRVEYIKVVNNVETIVENASDADYFRCYWRVDDGEKKAENQFIIGDLAFCEHTEVVDGSLVTKRYWRVVTGRNAGNTTTADGEAWIDLSNAHDANGNPVMTTISWEGQGGTTQTLSVKSFESSANSYPEAHDDICMLGCVVDTTRQGAIIEYVSGTDAPTYQIYQGLGSDATNPYVLTDKNQITIGYNSATGKADMKVYGDAYIGDRNRSTYIEYKQGDGTAQNPPQLDIKAVMQILPSSTYEGKSASQFVQDNQIKYDSAIQNLTNVTNDLQSQIDGEIVSWFYEGTPTLSNAPAVDWNTDVLKERHLGDMYYDVGTGLTSGFAYRFVKSEQGVYSWQYIDDTAITLALSKAAEALGLAATKAKTFTTASNTLPSPPYKTGDLWLNATGTWGSGDAAVTWNGDILKVKANINRVSGDTPLISDWELAGNYMNEQDFLDWKAGQYATDLTNAANNYLNDSVANAIKSALGSALGASTLTDGGLMLTSLIYLRKLNAGGDPADVNDYTTWAGISGEYDDNAAGGGIASWYGGNPIDKEALTPEQIGTVDPQTGVETGWPTLRWAKSIDRFDGSGYRANGNISWNENGALTIKNITTLSDSNNNNILNELATFNSAFTFGTSGQGSTTALYITPNVPFESLYIGTSNANKKEVATQEWVGNNYVSIAFFRQLFRAFKPNETAGQVDVEVEPNTIDAAISNIKAMVGFWTEQYVSALGQGSDGGGGGTGDVTWSALHSINTDPNREIDITYLTSALSGYATQAWVQAQGYLTQQSLSAYYTSSQTDAAISNAIGVLEYLNQVTGGNDSVILKTNKNTEYVLDFAHEHSWDSIVCKPSTLAGFGLSADLDNILQDYALRSWVSANFNNYSLPLSANGTRGGVQIGFTTDATNRNYAVLLSNEKMYVNVPWTDTVYIHPSGGADTTISAANGRVLSAITVNGLGHTTSVSYKALTMADMPSDMKFFNTIASVSDGVIRFTGHNITAQDVDFYHEHTWADILDKPASLAGFGIDKNDPLLKENYLTIEFFERLFNAYNGENIVHANSTSTIDSIKAMFGFWTEQYISALGLGDDGEAGSFNESQMWNALGTSISVKSIASTYLENATRFNAVTSGDNHINLSGVGVTSTALDLTHEHSWWEILDKPSSLQGYGIYDTYIEGTTVYIGGAHIDVVPSGSVDLTGYAKESWVSANYQVKGNYLTSADLSGYLPKIGGIMTGDISRRMTADTSNYENAIKWINFSAGTTIAAIGYHNTVQKIYLNPVGSSEIYNDAVGKYSLVIGNNTLTYNTKEIATQEWAQGHCVPKLGWWSSGDSHNVDSLTNGTTFAYTSHNAPTNGTIVAFSCTTNGYALQLQGQYSGENLYFRNLNGDNGTWQTWRSIIHSGNIGSQTVSNSDMVDGYHSSSFAFVGSHNDLTASGNEFTTAASGQTGGYWINYRTAGGLNGGITTYTLGNGSGGRAALDASDVTANGYLNSVSNGITVKIGSQNSSWAHIENNGGVAFWFNNSICSQGAVYPYVNNSYSLGTSSNYWADAYIADINIGSNRYYGDGAYGINMNNSDLIGCNSIRTLDLSDDYTEGLLFARTNGNWDSFRAADSNFYFQYNNGSNMMQMNTDGIYLYTGWLRTYGSTGWYNQSYGGGWYMEDSTWIRSYGGKYVWVDSYLCAQHISAGTSNISSTYALYVSGVGYFSSGVYSDGYVSALSDVRHKEIVSNTQLTVEQIANMRSVLFRWKDGKHDNGLYVGSIAQDWEKVLPQVVGIENNAEQTRTLQYGVAALVASITTARKVVDHEARIKALEKENKELREEISRLKIA